MGPDGLGEVRVDHGSGKALSVVVGADHWSEMDADDERLRDAAKQKSARVRKAAASAVSICYPRVLAG